MVRPNEGLATVENAFALIQVLSGSGPGGAGVARLCEETGMPRRTVYRYLSSLISLGLVELTAQQSNCYRLGPMVEELALQSSRQREFVRQSVVRVDELARMTDQMIHCTVYDQGTVVTVAASSQQINRSVRVGSRRPAHASASGKIFLAHQRSAVDAYVTRALTRLTPNTITQPDRLREECERVLAQGFALDNHEVAVGLCCVAVPIWGNRRQVVGTLSMTWSTDREVRVTDRCLRAMKSTAREFSLSIGGDPK
ncbi:MAG: IclR family transcriptional regulator [Propionibacteriaceae bacterium]|nr:IclR family transcriptional regulator [Propionibacteriaceae bacterium]